MRRSCQPILLVAVILSLPLLAFADEKNSDEKHGYFWYEDISIKKKEEAEKHPKPEMPSQEAMMAMHPAELGELLKQFHEYGTKTLKPEDVKNYWEVYDVVRRKSAAFTAVTGYVMLQNPELNSKSAYPSTNAARNINKQQHDQMISKKLKEKKGKYAFGYLSKEGCSYCVLMRQTLQHFQGKHGWRLEEFDVDKHPIIAARFNATVTPMLILVERGTERWAPVAVGAEALTSIEKSTYQAIRMLEGDIRPEQFYIDESRQGGFFDPAKHSGER